MTERYGQCVNLLVMGCLLSACGEQAGQQLAGNQWDESLWQATQIQQLERGRVLYGQNCAACHLASGEGQATLGAPALKGSAVVSGPVSMHIEVVLNGRGNGTMPGFAQSLDAQAIADIVNYERNAWGNHDPNLVSLDQVGVLKLR